MLNARIDARNTRLFLRNLVLPIAATLLAACSGGGGNDEGGAPSGGGNPAPIGGGDRPPIVTISAPSSNYDAEVSQSIDFSGSASDTEDGDLSDNLIWVSSIDGELGQGPSVSTLLSVGSHQVTARVTDSASQTSERSIQITINPVAPQNTSPQISIGSPADGTQAVVGEIIRFTGSASDNEQGDLSDAITWRSNRDGQLGTGASLDTPLSSGTHRITAAITDDGDLTATSEIEVIVSAPVAENVPPSLSVASPTQGAIVQLPQTVALVASAADPEDGDLSSSITWQSNIDGALGTGANLAVTLSTGSHVITAQVADSGGQAASLTRNITIEPAPVNQPPQVNIVSPNDNVQIELGQTLSLVGSASDPEQGDLSAQIFWSSSLDGNLGIGASRTVSLSEGTHVITAYVADSENLNDSTSITAVVVQQPENQAPQVTINSPSNSSVIEEGANTTLNGAATDQEDGDLSSAINWSSNLDGELGTGASLLVTLSVGEHILTATVSDSESLSANSTVSVTVEAAPNNEPELTITSPGNGTEQTVDQVVELTASATDQEDGDLSSSIAWRSNLDGSLGTGATVMTNLSEGEHLLTASVTDADEATIEESVTITITPVPNTAPELMITSPGSGQSFSSTDSISFTALATDAEDGDLANSINWSSSLDGALGTGASLSAQLNAGSHTITASVTDSAGELVQTSVTITVTAASNQATVSWQAPTQNTDESPLTNLTGFKVYYGVDATQLNSFETVNDPLVTSLVINDLNDNTTYYFAVAAVNAEGVESALSNVASKTFGTPP